MLLSHFGDGLERFGGLLKLAGVWTNWELLLDLRQHLTKPITHM